MADSATDFHDFERGKGNAYGEGAEEPQIIVEAASGWTKTEGVASRARSVEASGFYD
jgi:hypothetical protein